MKKINKSLTLVSIFLFIAFIASAQEYKPLIKVSKGEIYNYSIDMVMDMIVSAGGQEIKMETKTNYKTSNTIDNINSNGNVDVINSSMDVIINTKAMGKDSTINMTGKVGPTYKQQFDKLGNYISKVIIDSSQMDLNFNNSSNNISIFCEFPDKNLKPGDKWTKDRTDSIDVTQIGGKMGVKGQSEYTFGQKEKIDGIDLIKLTYTSTLTIGGKGAMMGMNIFMEGTGAATGEIFFNPANGIIYTTKGTIEMDINLAITGAQSMTMPMNQKITITQKLIK